MSRISDFLGPKGDTIHILLKRRGDAVAAIYKDDEREVRSPSLQKDKAVNDTSTRNS
jgi:hypothetical protein